MTTNTKMFGIIALVLLLLFVVSMAIPHLSDQSKIRSLRAMGGDVQVRDTFYEEWNPWRVGTPYRITFNKANLDANAMCILSASISARWKPVIVELRDCTVSSGGVSHFSNKAVEKLVLLNTTWIDGPAWETGVKPASDTAPEIQVFSK